MEFCPMCKKLLMLEGNIGRCSCGFVRTAGLNLSFEEKGKKKVHKGEGFVDAAKDENGFPHLCKKCGHGMADVHELGVFYGDETGVHLFKCKKCGYTERQGNVCGI